MFSHTDERELERLCLKREQEGLDMGESDRLIELFIRYREECKSQFRMMRG